MIRGLYTAASGMIAEQRRQDSIANNLANADTVGFKRDEAVMRSFPELLLSRINDGENDIPQVNLNKRPVVGSLGTGVLVEDVVTIFAPGSYRETSRNLDMAIEGSGFFVVETPQGERYTRNGSFKVNDQGELVTNEGFRVMGEQGAITIDEPQFHVTAAGEITDANGFVDMLRVVDFQKPYNLAKEGDLYAGANAQAAPEYKVRQGYLELSNVNSVKEMVTMITAMRSYEASSKAIQAHDSTLEKAVNEVGRV